MGFFNSYTKEGKGVGKDEVRPIRPLYFFEILFRKISKMFPLNMLYILLSLPVWIMAYISINVMNINLQDVANLQTADVNVMMLIGDTFYGFAVVFTFFSFLIGPATAGLTHVFKSFTTEMPSFIYSDFFESYKKNYKQSFLLCFITGIFMISFSLTLRSPQLYFLRIPSLIFFILLIFVNFYAYTILVMFKMKFIDIIKNSFIFALAKLPLNILLFAIICVAAWYSMMYTVIGIILTAVILYALCGFMVDFSVYPTIEKYMLEPANDNININDKDFRD